jgi:hypothetical protein
MIPKESPWFIKIALIPLASYLVVIIILIEIYDSKYTKIKQHRQVK